MAIVLNKIDPVIINNVYQQTSEEVVHTYEKTKVSKDKKENNNSGHSKKRMKGKLDKFNSILSVMDVDAHFEIDDEYITATDKNGSIIKRYTEDAVIELLNRMEDLIGVFVDTKK